MPTSPPIRCPVCGAEERTLPSGRTELTHNWAQHNRTAIKSDLPKLAPPRMVNHWTDEKDD